MIPPNVTETPFVEYAYTVSPNDVFATVWIAVIISTMILLLAIIATRR